MSRSTHSSITGVELTADEKTAYVVERMRQVNSEVPTVEQAHAAFLGGHIDVWQLEDMIEAALAGHAVDMPSGMRKVGLRTDAPGETRYVSLFCPSREPSWMDAPWLDTWWAPIAAGVVIGTPVYAAILLIVPH